MKTKLLILLLAVGVPSLAKTNPGVEVRTIIIDREPPTAHWWRIMWFKWLP